MNKIIIPIAAVKIGGALNSFYYDNAILRSDVIQLTDEINATAEGNFNLSITEIGEILNNAGEVEQHLMAVRAPIALLEQNVPEGLPSHVYFDGLAKIFRAWFNTGAEAWKKDDDSEIIFYTNPFAGNENSYLKGSEMAVINNISGSVEILTIADAQAETAQGWTPIT